MANFVYFDSYLPHTHPYLCFWTITSQQIFTKVDMCIVMCFDIVEIWFGIAIGYILQFLTESSPHDTIMVEYYRFMFLLAKQFIPTTFAFISYSFLFFLFLLTGIFLDIPEIISKSKQCLDCLCSTCAGLSV